MTLMLFFGLFHCFSIICGMRCLQSASDIDGMLHLNLHYGARHGAGNLIPPCFLILSQSLQLGLTPGATAKGLTKEGFADVTTKELSVKQELRPGECCCGLQHLNRVVKSWPWVCCAPFGWRKPSRPSDASLADTSHLPLPPV